MICTAGANAPPVALPAHAALNVKLVEFADTAVPLMLYAATDVPVISKPWLATREFATVTVATPPAQDMPEMEAAERLTAKKKDRMIVFMV
jgi:hypothetical protein